MAKLDDAYNSASMKQPKRVLDLSKVKISSDAEFFKYIDKVPELKLRPEQVEPEDVQIITDFSFKSGSHKQDTPGFNVKSTKWKRQVYQDPLPLSMRSTRLEDLWALDIHWKMLTSDRPPNRLDGDVFERLVDLGRFALAARKQEQVTIKAIMSSIIGTPAVTYLVALGFITSRSSRGALETRLKMCKNCGLELCSGAFCKIYSYDGFTRMIMDKDEFEVEDEEELAFLKQVSKAGTAGPSNPAAATKKPENKKKGGNLKMQIKKAKRKKKKKKVKENVEPVVAPDD